MVLILHPANKCHDVVTTVDGRNPFRILKKPWNDHSPVNTNNNGLPSCLRWCRISSIHSITHNATALNKKKKTSLATFHLLLASHLPDGQTKAGGARAFAAADSQKCTLGRGLPECIPPCFGWKVGNLKCVLLFRDMCTLSLLCRVSK